MRFTRRAKEGVGRDNGSVVRPIRVTKKLGEEARAGIAEVAERLLQMIEQDSDADSDAVSPGSSDQDSR